VVSNYVALGELGVMTIGRIVIPGLVGSGVGYFVLLITKFLFSFVRRFTATAPSLNPSGEARKPVDQGPIRRPTTAALPPLTSVQMRPAVSSSVPQLNLAGARALPARPRPAAETRESRRQQYYNALRTMFSANGGAAMDSPPGGPSVAAGFSSRGGLRSTLSSIEEAPEPQTGAPRPRASLVAPPSSEAPGQRRVRVTGASPPGTARSSSSKVKQEELAKSIDALLPAQVAYIIYATLFIFAVLCIYVTMAYSFRMDSPTAYIWLLSLGSCMLSFGSPYVSWESSSASLQSCTPAAWPKPKPSKPRDLRLLKELCPLELSVMTLQPLDNHDNPFRDVFSTKRFPVFTFLS
jgi:hypothetical protein